jgi:Cu-Zn family superoxide dismutase
VTVDARGRLFVAGRDTSRAFVYDATTGRLLRALRAPGAGRTLVNDVAVTPRAAYFTDSYRPVLYRTRLAGAQIGDLEPWLDLTATPIPTDAAFNLNGIAASRDGRHLVTIHFDTGRLFRIDTRTRAVHEVRLSGERLRTGDGLLLAGLTLLVVREEPGDIVPVHLSQDLRSGRVGTPFGRERLAFPTTVALRGDRLLVVNSQLDRAPDRARPPFTVAAIRPPGGLLPTTR